MALKPCLECKREISTEAKTCPHCGKSHPTSATSPAAQGCAGCLVVLIPLVVLGPCFGDSSSPSTAASPTHSQPESQGSTRSTGEYRLRAPTAGTDVVVAISENALEEMVSAGSDRAIAVMVLNGSGFLVPQSTPVSVVDGGVLTKKILVLEGPTLGQSGWVPSEWVVNK